MSSVTIYHNPRCNSSRQTLALLEAHGFTPKVIEYLKTPPTVAELKKILTQLHCTPRELMRTKEAIYSTLQLDNPKLNEDTLLQAMHDHPILIQRPIVIMGRNACIARPPETLLEMINT